MYVIKAKLWWVDAQGFDVSSIQFWNGDYWVNDIALAYNFGSSAIAGIALRSLTVPMRKGGGTTKQDWTPRSDEFTTARTDLEVVKID